MEQRLELIARWSYRIAWLFLSAAVVFTLLTVYSVSYLHFLFPNVSVSTGLSYIVMLSCWVLTWLAGAVAGRAEEAGAINPYPPLDTEGRWKVFVGGVIEDVVQALIGTFIFSFKVLIVLLLIALAIYAVGATCLLLVGVVAFAWGLLGWFNR